MYAVLKSREYETLSSDMAFLYDRQTSETGNSQRPLQDVVRSHGIRDNFEYLSASEDGFRKVHLFFSELACMKAVYCINPVLLVGWYLLISLFISFHV